MRNHKRTHRGPETTKQLAFDEGVPSGRACRVGARPALLSTHLHRRGILRPWRKKGVGWLAWCWLWRCFCARRAAHCGWRQSATQRLRAGTGNAASSRPCLNLVCVGFDRFCLLLSDDSFPLAQATRGVASTRPKCWHIAVTAR